MIRFERLERKLEVAKCVQDVIGEHSTYISGGTAVEVYLRDNRPDLYIEDAWAEGDVDIYVDVSAKDPGGKYVLIGEALFEAFGESCHEINPDEIYRHTVELGKISALWIVRKDGVEVQILLVDASVTHRIVLHDHPIVSVGLLPDGRIIHTDDFVKSLEYRVLIGSFYNETRKNKYLKRFPDFAQYEVEGGKWISGVGQVQPIELAVKVEPEF